MEPIKDQPAIIQNENIQKQEELQEIEMLKKLEKGQSFIGTVLDGEWTKTTYVVAGETKELNIQILKPNALDEIKKSLGDGIQLKILLPGMMRTMDWNPTRFNILIDEKFKIVDFIRG